MIDLLTTKATSYMENIIYGALVIGGFFVGYWIRKQRTSAKIKSAETRAEKILSEVKSKQSELLLKAQEKALKIIDEAKQDEQKRRQEINNFQARLEKRENTFSQKLLELQDKQQKLYDKIGQVEEVKEKIHQIKKEQLAKLEKIASLSKQEAQDVIIKNMEGNRAKRNKEAIWKYRALASDYYIFKHEYILIFKN